MSSAIRLQQPVRLFLRVLQRVFRRFRSGQCGLNGIVEQLANPSCLESGEFGCGELKLVAGNRRVREALDVVLQRLGLVGLRG